MTIENKIRLQSVMLALPIMIFFIYLGYHYSLFKQETDLRINALNSQLNTIQLVLMRNPVEIRPYHLIPQQRLKEK